MRCKKSVLPILVALLSQTSVAGECLAEMESGFCWPTGKDNPRITTKHLAHGSDRGGTYHKGLYHLGVDISAKEDSKVYPVADGVVVGKSFNGWTCKKDKKNYALLVRHKINDGNGTAFIALYGHLKGTGDEYSKDDNISVTDSIGVIGNYHSCGGDHLHFSIWPDKSTKPTGNYGRVRYTETKKDSIVPWPKAYGQTYPIKFLKEHEPFKELKRAFFYNGLAWIGSYDCYDTNNKFFEAEKRDGGVFLKKRLFEDMCFNTKALCDSYEVPRECTKEKPIDEFDSKKE